MLVLWAGMLEDVSQEEGQIRRSPKRQIGRGSVTIGTTEAATVGVVENGFVLVMEIALSSGEYFDVR